MNMHTAHFQHPENLVRDYHKSFASENNTEKFLFLRKYMHFVENDNSSFNILILFENPLKNDVNLYFKKDLNRNCMNFLESMKHSEDKHERGTALCFIGFAHEYGVFGYEQDYETAFDMYLVSSQLNNDLGTYRLALCFEQGKGTSRSNEEALNFYRCASKLGLVDALHVYGSILANGGIGSKVDQKTGLHYLSQAATMATKVYPYPLYDIGRWYETKQNTLDVSVDEEYSFQVYEKGAKLEDPNCQYRLAKCYENGELTQRKSLSTAVSWYKKAAENGQIDAQMMLFGLYSSGVPGCFNRDVGKSYYWALRAGIKCSPRALFYLGEYARSGTGIEEDILLALWWYTISAAMGSYEANIKMVDTWDEVRRRDLGPEIPYKCCGLTLWMITEARFNR